MLICRIGGAQRVSHSGCTHPCRHPSHRSMWTVNGQRPRWRGVGRARSMFSPRADVGGGDDTGALGLFGHPHCVAPPQQDRVLHLPRLPRPLQRVACLRHLRAGRPIGCTRPGTGSTRCNHTLHVGSDRGGVALERAEQDDVNAVSTCRGWERPRMPRERSGSSDTLTASSQPTKIESCTYLPGTGESMGTPPHA
jgi:hypothetical protein